MAKRCLRAGWILAFQRHAAAQRISPATVQSALQGVRYEPDVIPLDRNQKAASLSFEEFSRRHVTKARVARARALKRERSSVLENIESTFRVQREMLLAVWGLETDFGDNMGTHSSLSALSTLAWDCRRAELFRGELLSALRILERRDLTPDKMIGAWAGELGQTQFLPSSYERFAIDFDGDSKVDVVGSWVDALASTASYLKGHGWEAKQPYGRKSGNFAALQTWNSSEVYCRAIVAFAAKVK